MKQLAASLVKAQTSKDVAAESCALKQIADQVNPIRKVNSASSLPMPERFLSKLIFGKCDCWIWRGHVDAIGYGRFPYQGENKAHRVSFSIFKGEVPDGMKVLHKCDNRQCVNPDHLFLGTQHDNMQDMVRKGRGVVTPKFGESNPMAKLSNEQVEQIRKYVREGATQKSMCEQYGVSPMTISRIIRRKTWN